MNTEKFFPIGWLDKQFRRQPYPDMTYLKALDTAAIALWDLGTMEALDTADELGTVQLRMQTHHGLFAGLSMQSVSEFNELWRGKVTTLLKTSEGTK